MDTTVTVEYNHLEKNSSAFWQRWRCSLLLEEFCQCFSRGVKQSVLKVNQEKGEGKSLHCSAKIPVSHYNAPHGNRCGCPTWTIPAMTTRHSWRVRSPFISVWSSSAGEAQTQGRQGRGREQHNAKGAGSACFYLLRRGRWQEVKREDVQQMSLWKVLWGTCTVLEYFLLNDLFFDNFS